MSKSNQTPMMKQHSDIKEKHPDAFLFFRCGDFYELFHKDAVDAARILDINLTKRGDIPMCGVPYHAVDVYIAKMIRAGRKVAICEQMENPKDVKGIVKRGVTQVITPGTLIEEKHLANKSNNFLFALNIKGLYVEIAYLDLSTGDFEINEFEYSQDLSVLKGELVRIAPKEIIIPENIWLEHDNVREIFEETSKILVNRYPLWYFESAEDKKNFLKHFNISDVKEIGIYEHNTDLTTPAVLLKYAKENAKSLLGHVRHITFNSGKQCMTLDEATVKNLELIVNNHDGSISNTLLETIDDTSTAMGARLIKKWLIEPLVDINEINKRLNIVEYFYKNQVTLNKLESHIKKIVDLERLASRVVMDRATPKDLVSIRHSIDEIGNILKVIRDIDLLSGLASRVKELTELSTYIKEAIKDEPANMLDDGNIVRDGYHEELDELKEIRLKTKEYIAKVETDLREKYNTPSLKIKYNKIIGYFFEVSKVQSKNLDDSFILRQSLVNNSRYSNKTLSEYESKILTAKDQISEIEKEVFYKVRDEVVKCIPDIQDNAKVISQIDVLLSFAKTAIKRRYTKPVVKDDYGIVIKEGRHPVIEQKLDFNSFIPNDVNLTNNEYLMVITGPNMSGKSTYLRQNALITLMAQVGSFVPAASAEIGIVDRIFTRIGTGDNLARGQSTFLVEMTETANILKYATNKSLIIMDEIGRGTSTYDGLSIAWSILEYISNEKVLGAKTLFATHYHELTELEAKHGIKNLSVAISEEGDTFTFLHKIIEEPAEKSYGIHVAKMANLPDEVVEYADVILSRLENKKENTGKVDIKEVGQLDLFGAVEQKSIDKSYKEIIDSVKFLNINNMTPLQALNLLNDLKKKISKKKL